jgi:uncharacterized protein YdaU (DUF1376 family)
LSKIPYLKLWVSDFLGDTLRLDTTETGAYLMLLLAAWQTPDCSIPDDDRDLARFARCSAKVWRRVKPRVMPYWRMCPDGKWRNPRLLKEFMLASQVSLTKAANRRGMSLKLNGAHLTFDERSSIICGHNHSHISKKEGQQEEQKGTIGPEERYQLMENRRRH